MTSQLVLQTVARHILLNISRIKGDQAMEFGQLIGYNERNIFLYKSWENEAARLIPDLFFPL